MVLCVMLLVVVVKVWSGEVVCKWFDSWVVVVWFD